MPTSVTLHIAPGDAAQGGFPLTLIEEDDRRTPGLLATASLAGGPWTIAVEGGALDQTTDVVATMTETPGAERDQIDFSTAGQFLFDCLFPPGPVRDRWRALPADTRLYLEIDDKSLALVPWELARTANPQRLLAINHVLTRLGSGNPGETCYSAWPFRILFVIGCSAAEETALGVRKELTEIERIFLPWGRSVDVHRLERPDRDTLMKWIRRSPPHVLHFAGHAGEVPGGGVGLRFDLGGGNKGEPWYWRSTEIEVDLPAWNWVPQFVFLNACRSAVEQGTSWSLQQSFLSGAARAVLAMQGDVEGDLAGVFAARLYAGCVAGKPIEEAVLEARTAVINRLGGYTRVDWALPALTTRERSFTLFKPLAPPADPEFEECKEFEEARFFAALRDARRIFTHWVCPPTRPASDAEATNVLVLTGPPKAGKSHLLKWCMESWALHGARVRYIELDSGPTKNAVEVLRQLRDGEADDNQATKYLHQGLPREAFARFNWELNNLLRSGQPGEWKDADHAGEVIVDEGARFVPDAANLKLGNRLEPLFCKPFLDALRTTATKRPLIIVFDNFRSSVGERKVDVDSFEQLVLHLFRPIADDRDSRVKLVFGINGADVADHRLHRLPKDRYTTYELSGNYTDEQLADAAAEMLWFKEEERVRKLATALLQDRDTDTETGLALLSHVLAALQSTKRRLVAEVQRMK